MIPDTAQNTDFFAPTCLPDGSNTGGGIVVPWINANTRVDAPHETGQLDPSAADESVPRGEIMPDDALSDQIHLQANQLAVHLRNRQRELDHRESELNARIARLEADERSARLCIDQRETDLAAREAVLTDREQKLHEQKLETERRLARLAAADAALQRHPPELDAAKFKELQDAAESLALRRQQLDEAEKHLAESQAESNAMFEQLAADRRELLDRTAAAAAQTAADRKEMTAELAENRRAVERRAEFVDERWATLREFQAELERVHRETLELRLATEELWTRLSSTAPSATLMQSLNQIRAQLADHYTQANAALAQQRQELESLRSQVAGQLENLVERKRQFDLWAASSQENCRRQTDRLIARERELQEQELLLHQQSQRWHAERLRYQLELERLQSRAAS